MKTKITISLLIVASLVITTGCEDFLQKDPQGELTQEAFPVTASDALLATNAVYVTVRTWTYHSGGYPILDIMSDDAHKGSNPNDQLPTVGPYETFTHTTTQDGLDRWWSALYEGIKRANVVIEKVPSINMNEQLRNRYIAEASFLRGLFYFDLVRAFGGVPKVTSTTPATKTPRSTDAEIYELIISDLEFAAQHLPEKSLYAPDDAGRATKGAAKSLLARVCLFMGDYKNVEKYALEVIASDEYDLEDDFADANGKNGEHGIESVFEIGAMEVEGAG